MMQWKVQNDDAGARRLVPMLVRAALICLGLIISKCAAAASTEWNITPHDTTQTEKELIDEPWSWHEKAVNSVAFSPDARILASGNDHGIVLWDLTSMKTLGEPLIGHHGVVWSVVFSPDGKILASGGADGTVVLWDIANLKTKGEPVNGHDGWVEGVSFSPDGRTLAS